MWVFNVFFILDKGLSIQVTAVVFLVSTHHWYKRDNASISVLPFVVEFHGCCNIIYAIAAITSPLTWAARFAFRAHSDNGYHLLPCVLNCNCNIIYPIVTLTDFSTRSTIFTVGAHSEYRSHVLSGITPLTSIPDSTLMQTDKTNTKNHPLTDTAVETQFIPRSFLPTGIAGPESNVINKMISVFSGQW
jgi:hypothetical protein